MKIEYKGKDIRWHSGVRFVPGVNDVNPSDYNKLKEDKNYQKLKDEGVFIDAKDAKVPEVKDTATKSSKKPVVTSVEAK